MSKHLCFNLKGKSEDDEGRFLFLKGQLDNRIITLGSIYTPIKEQLHFLQSIFSQLDSYKRRSTPGGGGAELNH